MNKSKQVFVESFDNCLVSHIDWCIDDQENYHNNIVSAKDYTPMYDKLHDDIYQMIEDRDITEFQLFGEVWDRVHDNLDFHDYLELSERVIRG